MLGRLFILLAFLFPAIAHSESFPNLFHVNGVASNDVLNIRQDPTASSPIVGTLAPQARNIEIIEADPTGKWGWVNLGESGGWASLRFLKEADMATNLKEITCYGTEPYWTLSFANGGPAQFEELGGTSFATEVAHLIPFDGRTDRFTLDLGRSQTAVLRRAACDDGMSDLRFGMEIDLIDFKGLVDDTPRGLSGCCSLIGY